MWILGQKKQVLRRILWVGLATLVVCLPKPSLAQTVQSAPSTLLAPGIMVDAAATSQAATQPIPQSTRSQYGTYERALVRETREQIIRTDRGAQRRVTYKLEILTGKQKDALLTTVTDQSSLPAGVDPRIGDTVIVFLQPSLDQTQPVIFFEGYDRQNAYFWVLLALLAGCLFIAGWKGLKICLAVGLTWLMIFDLALPLYFARWSTPLIALIFFGLFSGILSCLLLGLNRKSLIAFAGTLVSGSLAYGIMDYFITSAHLESVFCSSPLFTANTLLDPKAMLLLGATLVVIGFILDLALSIASGVTELKMFSNALGLKELFRSGMIIGQERLNFMAPVILLVCLGTSLLPLSQVIWSNYPWLKFINSDDVTQAILLPLVGIFALLLSVPICSLIASLAWTRNIRVMDPLHRATSWRQEEPPPPDDQLPLPLS